MIIIHAKALTVYKVRRKEALICCNYLKIKGDHIVIYSSHI